MKNLQLNKTNTRRNAYLLVLCLVAIMIIGLVAIGAEDLFTGGANAMDESKTLLLTIIKKAFWVALIIDLLCVIFKHDGKAIAKEASAAGIAIIVRIIVALIENGSLEATIDLISGWLGGSAAMIVPYASFLH